MAHAVDQAAAVAALLADDLAQELADLVVVGRILDIFQNVIQLVHDLQVRAAVLGALQRADGRADGRIGVRAGAGQHAAGEGRAVAAAVVRVDEQAEVEQTRFLVGELLGRRGRCSKICSAVLWPSVGRWKYMLDRS